jgi:transposase
MGKRRGHGEGAIYQRESDGRWCTSVDLGIINGKRKRKVIYGKTRKEVAEKLKALQRDQHLGVNLAVEQMTVGQFLDHWLAAVVLQRNRPRTHRSYSDTVRLYIKPHIGDRPLTRLTPELVQAMLNTLHQQGLSPRTVAYTRAVLRKALNQALRWNHVARNVATLVDVPAAQRHRLVTVHTSVCHDLWYTRGMLELDDNARLLAENAELRTVVAQLQEQLTTALARIAELEQRPPDPPAFVKPNTPPRTVPKQPRKKRAAHHNRVRRREAPTQTVVHALARCPDCQYQLRGTRIAYRRQVIELPAPPPIDVIEHQVIKRWCPVCRCWHQPTLDLQGQVLGRGRIGVRLASVISYLRTTLRLPLAAIQQYLTSLHQLTLSVGGIQGVLQAVQHATHPAVEQLKQQVRQRPVLHGDETGWRENGQNGYIWSFSTLGSDAVRYYEYDRSRSQAVVKRILQGQFHGHLVSDFYAGYNAYPGKHQRCWVHLLRDLSALKQAHPHDAAVVAWAQTLRTTYDEAMLWRTANAQAPPDARAAQYVTLTSQTHRLGQQYARVTGHPCQPLAKRLLRHEDELFQFILVPDLAADNNLAERAIRPLVVIRKVSGGSRSPQGTTIRMTLASLFHTWQARGLNPFDQCVALLRQAASHT